MDHMNGIRVWAPAAGSVQLVTRDLRVEMSRQTGGWWVCFSEHIQHGLDYKFSIDGKDPLPDPRSGWQPYGVHGYSRYVEHSLFQWRDRTWQPHELGSAVIYELHTGTFSEEGTFKGITGHLDHLQVLGITHIELMPVNSFSGDRGWGYDGVYPFAPMECYGGPDGLKMLVDECHRRGFSMILDVVYNHLGPEGNYLGHYGPYFTEKYTTPWGSAINFDGPGSDEVRRFFIDNAIMWLRDYHFDVLRIDAVHSIFDMSALHFLEELSSEVDQLSRDNGRKKYVIAESDLNDPRIITPGERGGYGIHAQWCDDLHHSVHAFLTGERTGYYQDFGKLEDIAKALKKGYVWDGKYSSFRKRRHGRSSVEIRGDRLVGFIQDHDQVGNRARGERLDHLVGKGMSMCAAALYICSPFIPMLFQGEEWAAETPFQYFTSHGDPELGKAVTSGRRREFLSFGWKEEDIPDPQDLNTFLRSRLKWKELSEEEHGKVLEWYRELVALRKKFPELHDGSLDGVHVHFSEEKKWFSFQRGRILLVFNFSYKVNLIHPLEDPCPDLLLASDPGCEIRGNELFLPSPSVALLRCMPIHAM